MNMHIKIYINQKPLFLCDAIDDVIEPYIHRDDTIYMDEMNIHATKSIIHELQQDPIHAAVYQHKNLDELKKVFFKRFTLVVAAGGFITNEKGQYLMIFRRGKWDLPKGKLDNGETLEECAVREVKEETGLGDVQLLSPLITTYHSYEEGTHHMLKESHWFRMNASEKQKLIPQEEEHIEKIVWAKPSETDVYMKNSFPSVADVVKKALSYKL